MARERTPDPSTVDGKAPGEAVPASEVAGSGAHTTVDQPRAQSNNRVASLRPHVTDAIVGAVFDELASKGFVGLSMDRVARRAGVGKGALYRRWASKEEMTVGVLSMLSVTDVPVADTGSLRGDVRALLDDILEWLAEPRIRRIYPDLLAEAQRNPVLAEALTDHIGNPRRVRAQSVLDRAAARGELSGSADQDLIVDLFAAMIFWRLIALRRPVTDSHLEKVVDLVLYLTQGGGTTQPTAGIV